MGSEKSYRTVSELVKALAQAEQDLSSKGLDLSGLERVCEDTRELYERLVVLRHKAREARITGAAAPATERPDPAESKGTVLVPDKADTVSDGIRLDTRPVEISPRQTSLIEAIEASEQVPPAAKKAATTSRSTRKIERGTVVADDPRGRKEPATVAEKLEKAAIPDLAKAISLSHKFWFVAELFSGDRITYDKTINLLNGMGTKEAALAHVEKEVLPKLTKPADPEALATFTELIQRRFA